MAWIGDPGGSRVCLLERVIRKGVQSVLAEAILCGDTSLLQRAVVDADEGRSKVQAEGFTAAA